jgi:hypothetical protein
MKVALTCIAKAEDNYIDEWIDYHLKLGFDDIYVYQNNWYFNVKKSNVYSIEINGYAKQEEAYNHFLKTYKDDYDWVAFFDIDEFLVLKQHKDIKQFLLDYNGYKSVGINWVFFGDNGLEFCGDYSVLNRFIKRQIGVDKHVKSIVKMNSDIIYAAHAPINVDSVDTNYNTFNGPFNPNGDDKIAQLNHYFCKTKEEWVLKKNRGSVGFIPTHENFIRNDVDYTIHNKNEIEDKHAINFFLKKQ